METSKHIEDRDKDGAINLLSLFQSNPLALDSNQNVMPFFSDASCESPKDEVSSDEESSDNESSDNESSHEGSPTDKESSQNESSQKSAPEDKESSQNESSYEGSKTNEGTSPESSVDQTSKDTKSCDGKNEGSPKDKESSQNESSQKSSPEDKESSQNESSHEGSKTNEGSSPESSVDQTSKDTKSCDGKNDESTSSEKSTEWIPRVQTTGSTGEPSQSNVVCKVSQGKVPASTSHETFSEKTSKNQKRNHEIFCDSTKGLDAPPPEVTSYSCDFSVCSQTTQFEDLELDGCFRDMQQSIVKKKDAKISSIMDMPSDWNLSFPAELSAPERTEIEIEVQLSCQSHDPFFTKPLESRREMKGSAYISSHVPFRVEMKYESLENLRMSVFQSFWRLQPQQLEQQTTNKLVDFYLLWIQRDCSVPKDFVVLPIGFYRSLMEILCDNTKSKKISSVSATNILYKYFYTTYKGKNRPNPFDSNCICIPFEEERNERIFYSCVVLFDLNLEKPFAIVFNGMDRDSKGNEIIEENFRNILRSLRKDKKLPSEFYFIDIFSNDIYSSPFRVMMAIYCVIHEEKYMTYRRIGKAINEYEEIDCIEERLSFTDDEILQFQKDLYSVLCIMGSRSKQVTDGSDVEVNRSSARLGVKEKGKVSLESSSEKKQSSGASKKGNRKVIKARAGEQKKRLSKGNRSTSKMLAKNTQTKRGPTKRGKTASQKPTRNSVKGQIQASKKNMVREKEITGMSAVVTSQEVKKSTKLSKRKDMMTSRKQLKVPSKAKKTAKKTELDPHKTGVSQRKRKADGADKTEKKKSSRRLVSDPPGSVIQIKDEVARRIGGGAITKVEQFIQAVIPVDAAKRRYLASLEPFLICRDEIVPKPHKVRDTLFHRENPQWSILSPSHITKEAFIVRLKELIRVLEGITSSETFVYTSNAEEFLESLYGVRSETDGKKSNEGEIGGEADAEESRSSSISDEDDEEYNDTDSSSSISD